MRPQHCAPSHTRHPPNLSVFVTYMKMVLCKSSASAGPLTSSRSDRRFESLLFAPITCVVQGIGMPGLLSTPLACYCCGPGTWHANKAKNDRQVRFRGSGRTTDGHPSTSRFQPWPGVAASPQLPSIPEERRRQPPCTSMLLLCSARSSTSPRISSCTCSSE